MLYIILKLILVLFQFTILIYAGYMPDKLINHKTIEITKFKGDCRGQDVAIQSFYYGMRMDNWRLYFTNTTQVVKEDLPENLRLNINIRRCRSRENLDTCEEFQNFQNIDFCQSINPDNFMLSQSPFAVIYQPKFKCPLKKGTYVAHNASMSLAPFMFMTSANWYWRVTGNTVQHKGSRLLQCTEVEGQIVTKTRRQQ